MSNDTVTPTADIAGVSNATGDAERIERDALLARLDAADEAARAVNCGVSDCDGTGHCGDEDPADWNHRVYSKDLDGFEVEIHRHADGAYLGWMALDYIDEADANKMRLIAAELSGYVLELIEAAARIDALNAAAAE